MGVWIRAEQDILIEQHPMVKSSGQAAVEDRDAAAEDRAAAAHPGARARHTRGRDAHDRRINMPSG